MTEKEKLEFLERLMGKGNTTIGQVIMDNHGTMNINNNTGDSKRGSNKEEKEITKEQLAQAVVNCQRYFWANSAYAVLYCLIRDDLKKDCSQSSFERMVELLPYSKERDHQCPTGTISNAFSDNSFYKLPIEKWEKNGAPQRVLLLVSKLREELQL